MKAYLVVNSDTGETVCVCRSRDKADDIADAVNEMMRQSDADAISFVADETVFLVERSDFLCVEEVLWDPELKLKSLRVRKGDEWTKL